jgi:hypothetical protein
LISAIDLPIMGDGAKRRLDAVTFASWLNSHAPTHVFCENARSMPRQGVTSMFRYGRVAGGWPHGMSAPDCQHSTIRCRINLTTSSSECADSSSATEVHTPMGPGRLCRPTSIDQRKRNMSDE